MKPDGDSADGQRNVDDFLTLLKIIVFPRDFHLETISTRQAVDAHGTIDPGFYLIGLPVYIACVLLYSSSTYICEVGPSEGYYLAPVWTFPSMLATISGVYPEKKRKLSETVTLEGATSQRVSLVCPDFVCCLV
jgi:hypothetical protein